jgi:hypothetical protein
MSKESDVDEAVLRWVPDFIDIAMGSGFDGLSGRWYS